MKDFILYFQLKIVTWGYFSIFLCSKMSLFLSSFWGRGRSSKPMNKFGIALYKYVCHLLHVNNGRTGTKRLSVWEFGVGVRTWTYTWKQRVTEWFSIKYCSINCDQINFWMYTTGSGVQNKIIKKWLFHNKYHWKTQTKIHSGLHTLLTLLDRCAG